MMQATSASVSAVSPSDSSASDKLVQGYLKAFGITVVSKETLNVIPSVFNTKHAPEWKAFIESFVPSNAKSLTLAKRALYSITEFLRYMRHVGINPFIKAVKAPALVKGSKIDSQSVYTNLLAFSLADIVSQIIPVIRGTHLLTKLDKSKAKTRISGNSDYVITSTFVLHPKKKNDSLDGILSQLQGFLYTSREVPIQLRETYKKVLVTSKIPARISTPNYRVLQNTESHIGWLTIKKDSTFNVYVARAKSSLLILRIEVPIVLDISLGHKVRPILTKSWETAIARIK